MKNEEINLPCDPNAEQLVIGAILSDELCLPDVFTQLTDADFGLQKNQLIFAKAKLLYEAKQPITASTVITELEKTNELESVGAFYVTELSADMPKLVALNYYINVIIDKSQKRRLYTLALEIQQRATDRTQPAGELLHDFKESLAALLNRYSESSIQNAEQVVQEIGLQTILDGQARGFSTGFSDIDHMLSGLHAGDLFLIGAKPGMGKTTLAMNIGWNVAKSGRSVAVFSMEMNRQLLLHRLICSLARIDSQTLGGGSRQMGFDERQRVMESAAQLQGQRLWLDERRFLTVYDIIKTCRQLKHKQGLDLVIIDYLGLLAPLPGRRREQNKNLEVSENARLLKTALAGELGVCCMALSQLNRKIDERSGNRRPVMSDLRDSGDLEAHADVVSFVYREEMYRRDEPSVKNQAELIIAKQRNGPTGWIALRFYGNYYRFETATKESDYS